MIRSRLPAILTWLTLAAGALGANAQVALDADGKVTLGGDFRLRLEQDWDSRRADGSERLDRARARVRARLALGWRVTDELAFGLRLRSGAAASHQSPHVTVVDFDGNDTGDADFTLDRWFLGARSERAWGWVGRNGFPFWKQNELFWDDDVTPAGAAGGLSRPLAGGGILSLRLGYLSLPVGMKAFSGRLGAGQVVFERDAGVDLTLAAGLYDFDADPDDPDAGLLRNGNGRRDYSIVVASAQVAATAAGRPLTLGLDLMHNRSRYAADDPYAFANRDASDGLVISARWGSAAARGSWQLGYGFARVEALAVNASYAQDDWVRWGSAVETDSSDFEGHELRAVYGLGDAGRLVARLYLVEALSSRQDGKRFRLDWNLTF